MADFFNFRRFSTLLVTLHDHFLKNFFRIRFALLLYLYTRRLDFFTFSVALRFRWDCKGRNLFQSSKINVKIYFGVPSLIPAFK